MTVAVGAWAQDPTGTIEGHIYDPSGAVIPRATVKITQVSTGVSHAQITGDTGTFAFPFLPVGAYELTAEAKGFALYKRGPLQLSINERLRIEAALVVAGAPYEANVTDTAPLVDTSTNTLGKVVTSREILDLPLNGRNFTQLGLLQVGVAPLTQGVMTAGGSLRSGQAYAVNGQRPESNNYVLDGSRIVNQVDGGNAIRIPIDAISEFRILTHTAPPEYGNTSGATTSVVTRSGSNQFHGSGYEFFRNDVFDARNFFSQEVEPLKQNQFGGTIGGPIKQNKTFFFGYYEGFRNRQGVTRRATVPTPDQRQGNFQNLFLFNFGTGQMDPFVGTVPINPISQEVLNYYPLGNVSPSLYVTTQVMRNNNDQFGVKLDHQFSSSDSLSARYSYATGSNYNPLSIKGADVPGFPVGDDITAQSATISETHSFSERTLNTLRASYFRNAFLFDQRFNQTPPSALGFQYESTLPIAEGPPFFIVNGYSSVGDPITGPRDTVQNSFEISDSIAHVRGHHTIKVGGEFRRHQINAMQGIASNGFFVFAPFPFSDPFANFLTGFPVVFFQAGGQMDRYLRTWEIAGFAQDEWRVNSRLTLNVGVRYEVSTPYAETQNRLNAFAPGQQSSINPNAPEGLLFPGDAGVTDRISPIYKNGWMPRIGFAYDPTGSGKTSIRAGYGISYDPIANGVGGPLQAAISALPWTQARQVPPPVNYADPWNGAPPFSLNSFPAPMTILTNEQNMKPPYAQNWNFTIQRSLGNSYLFDIRYVGTTGTHLPRFIEANPSVYHAGMTPDEIDQNRIHAGCPVPPATGPCNYASVGLLTNSTSSTYHAAQVSVTKRFSSGLGFLASYTLSNTLDYVSSLNLAGSAPRLVSGENDVAQNPFDLGAEHGPSLFDSRHRFSVSAIYELPKLASAHPATRAFFGGWQISGIAIISSATPFTVYDSNNVAMQGSHPEISGFSSGRPDLIGDPNAGPHTPDQWLTTSAFRRLDISTEAGQFGNAGRNIARGPGYGALDLGLSKFFTLGETTQLQFRAETFNLTNHANFGLPVNDLNSPNFGTILESGPPRLLQFALKIMF
jgi:outer membrane receptor protein involved in Fe transport